MRIIWIGFHIEGLDAFIDVSSRYNVVAFLTLKQELLEKRSANMSYKKYVQSRNIEYHEISHINSEDSINLCKRLKPDLLVVLGWGQILNAEVLRIPTIGCIGAHASLLPSYRGSAPINWALINGLEVSGNSLIWLSPDVDQGEIIDQIPFEITLYDDCDTLYKKVARTNSEMLLKALQSLSNGQKIGTPQGINTSQLLPRRRPNDGIIDFNKPAKEVYNFIRALKRPYPGSYATLNSEKVIFWRASLIDLDICLTPGEIVIPIYSPETCSIGVAIGCKKGLIAVQEIEFRNKIFDGSELISQFNQGIKFNHE